MVNTIIYLCFGLALFFYLFINQLVMNLTDKPEVYKVFLDVVIILNIISGIVRLVGSILLLVLHRMISKMNNCKRYLFYLDIYKQKLLENYNNSLNKDFKSTIISSYYSTFISDGTGKKTEEQDLIRDDSSVNGSGKFNLIF
jgi:hypothetical protein